MASKKKAPKHVEVMSAEKKADWQRRYDVEVAAINAFVDLIPRWQEYKWMLLQLTTLLCKVVWFPDRRRKVWAALEIDKARRVRDGAPMCAYAVATLWEQSSLEDFQEKLNAEMNRVVQEDLDAEAALAGNAPATPAAVAAVVEDAGTGASANAVEGDAAESELAQLLKGLDVLGDSAS